MAVSDAVRLRAAGVEVTLADGRAYPLVFDFEALCVLEEDTGGLEAFADALTDAGRRLRTVRTGMVAGLVHTGLPRAQIVRLLEYRRTAVYLDAISEAFIQAMPAGVKQDAAPKGRGSRASSRGNASTGSRRSASVAAKRSSGA